MYILQSTSVYLKTWEQNVLLRGISERNIKDFNELATPKKQSLDLEPANLGPVPWCGKEQFPWLYL